MDSTTDLPKSQVKRIVKAKLSELYRDEDAHKRNVALSKDVLTAFAESGRVFISHVTAAANDVCRDAKRSTVTGDDILQALRNVEFEEFVEPLRSLLEEFRAELKEKNRRRVENRLLKEAAAAEKKESTEASHEAPTAETPATTAPVDETPEPVKDETPQNAA